MYQEKWTLKLTNASHLSLDNLRINGEHHTPLRLHEGSVSESFVDSLVIIIPFDIFEESQANLFNVFKNTELAQPFGFQFSP